MDDGLVWVTGGKGFLGRRISEALGRRAHVAPGRDEVDLLDAIQVRDFLASRPVAAIVHAAGFVGGIGLHRAHPGRVALENLRMGLNVLDAAAKRRGVRVCIVSTVCAYPESAPVPTPESAIFDGYPAEDTAHYGLAKRALLTVADGLRREFGLPYSYVIPTNLYGPGDHFDEARSHVVPALIRRAIEARAAGARTLTVWGDGTPTRDLLFVDDAARGIVAALEPEADGEVFNLGSGREVTIRELAEAIVEIVGFEGEIVWDPTKPGGAKRRALDPAKAARILGFGASVGLREGLRRTVDWYRARIREPHREER